MLKSLYRKKLKPTGICRRCGVGIPLPPAVLCPFCIELAARSHAVYAAADRDWNMGKLRPPRYSELSEKKAVAI